MLAILIDRAKKNGDFRGAVPHLVDDGLSILQYADDTILFIDHDLNHAKNPLFNPLFQFCSMRMMRFWVRGYKSPLHPFL
jgi:hypothetical protein